MLRLEGLHAHYGWLHAVKGVTLQVNTGEIVALVGPNGAGKTTILKTVMGLVLATRGKVIFDGQDITGFETEAVVGLGVGLVPEGRELFTNLSVMDNLRLGSFLLRGRSGQAEMRARLELVFHLFPTLQERTVQMARTLSGGEQQMLAIGRALMSRPKLMLLDEPSTGLAPMLVAEIFRVIDSLRQEGATILVVEQNTHVVLSVADRGYVIRQGEIVAADTAAKLLSDPTVASLYLGGQASPRG